MELTAIREHAQAVNLVGVATPAPTTSVTCSTPTSNVHGKAIARDALLIVAATALAGVVIELTQPSAESLDLAAAASNFLVLLIAFTISGARAKDHRFKHLFAVAFVIWIISAVNMPLLGMGVGIWFAAGIFGAVMAVIGGAVSFLFAPARPAMT